MQAVVLAAGEGTRLEPLTEDRPKGLVPVAGQPLLDHCFSSLAALGIDEFVVVVGYHAEAIIDRYGDAFETIPITYVHQRERLGLAHALLQAEPHIDGDFVLLNGDNVFRANLDEALDRHRDTDATVTLLVDTVTPEAARETGVLSIDEDGEVTGLVEKPSDPPSTLVTTGFFVFDPVIFHACHLVQPSDRGEYELADAIDLVLGAGHHIETVELDGWRVNVNTEGDIETVEAALE